MIKITDEAHNARMTKRRAKRASLTPSRYRYEVRKGGPPFNDGFDQVRLDRAAEKARVRAAKRAR